MILHEGSVFRVDNNLDVFIRKEAYALVPELQEYDLIHLKWALIVYDPYDSFVWRKPEREKRLFANRRLFEDDSYDPVEMGLIPDRLIELIKTLTYNSDAAKMQLYLKKIDELQQKLFNELDPNSIDKIAVTIQKLETLHQEAENNFIQGKEKIIVKGAKKLSWIEEKQRSMKLVNRGGM